MDYELAKELKEAGFPQETERSYGYRTKEGWMLGATVSQEYHGFVSAPTLDELMEECVNLHTLKKTAPERGSMKARWIAVGVPYLYDVHAKEIRCVGKTRIEAVAKFWLEANR